MPATTTLNIWSVSLLFSLKGRSKDLQSSGKEDSKDCELVLAWHMQTPDHRKGENENGNIADHIGKGSHFIHDIDICQTIPQLNGLSAPIR